MANYDLCDAYVLSLGSHVLIDCEEWIVIGINLIDPSVVPCHDDFGMAVEIIVTPSNDTPDFDNTKRLSVYESYPIITIEDD